MVGLDPKKSLRDFRVGLIAFASLFLLIMGVTFAGGDKGLLFKKTSILNARLTNVGGLKKGASVAIGGMTVGKVVGIAFVGDSKINLLQVAMEVRSDVRNRVKTDSISAVRTQGMLGDRYVDISPGTEDASPLSDGDFLTGESATDFDETLRKAQEVLKEIEKLLTAINDQQGTMGQFLYDEKFYGNLTEMSYELNDLIKDFKKQPRKYIKFSLF